MAWICELEGMRNCFSVRVCIFGRSEIGLLRVWNECFLLLLNDLV